MSASITAPRGLQTLNPSPEISRYYNKANTPYTNTAQVLSEVSSVVRYIGQTFLVVDEEWWFKSGKLNTDLVLKQDSGTGITDLDYTPSPTQGTITSSTGTDAIIPLANETNAGLITPDEKNKIGEIPSGKYTFSFPIILPNGDTYGRYTNGEVATFTDKTIPEIIQQIGQKVLSPTLINPTFSISLPNYTQREVGSTYSELMTANFNPGQIKGKLVAGVWQDNTKQNDRAGEVSDYILDGTTQVGNTKTVSKVLESGDNTFSGSVNYLTGVQPTNSAGENFDSPYPPGTLSDSKIIRAAYPVFYGTLNIGQTILDINLSTFTKVTNINPNNTVSIPYSNVLGKQLVILIPVENTIKTKWYVTESNKGGIDGITGDLFALPVTASYDSPTLLWLGKSYRVYISTPTSINTTIELRN